MWCKQNLLDAPPLFFFSSASIEADCLYFIEQPEMVWQQFKKTHKCILFNIVEFAACCLVQKLVTVSTFFENILDCPHKVIKPT